ncbi:ribonuclease HI [Candidatus Peregrinibacteria bacterium]|nr:ribonuclease HI [Candidatus Peregrinibacteria bacterium]
MQTRKIEIYTDGSCLGNPGPGGWGAMILIDGKEESFSGSEKDTTNNRMEMTAIIKALEWIKDSSGLSHEDLQSHKILIHSDSNLIIQTLNQGWKRKANTDLWAEMDRLRAWLDIEWKWVKAHADNKLNNFVDELAFKAAQKASKS